MTPSSAPPLGVADALTRDAIEWWLRATDETRLEELWAAADEARSRYVGDAVHLRGLVEVSNYCVRGCTYCGIRAANRGVERYRVSEEVVLDCAHKAVEFGYGTLVMQAGEDYGITREWLVGVLRRIRSETTISAITLSLGERPDEDLAAWREAGGDRYLLRFETSDDELYRRIHPDLPGKVSDRMRILRRLQELGFEAGTGIMVGIPGQTHASIADDIELFRGMDMDMIGIGPYLPHPATPLGQEFARRQTDGDWPEDQAPNTELMTCKALALTRLARPDANLPATTALSLVNKAGGRAHGLQRGGNVVMPNLTAALVARPHRRRRRRRPRRRLTATARPCAAPCTAARPEPRRAATDAAPAPLRPTAYARRAGRPHGRPAHPLSTHERELASHIGSLYALPSIGAISGIPIVRSTVGSTSTSRNGAPLVVCLMPLA